MERFIVFAGTVMPLFLSYPLLPCFWRFTQSKAVLINTYPGISPVGSHIDEQVIITAGQMVMGSKTFMPEEDLFFITEIPPYAHVRDAGKCIREIL